MSGKTWQSSSGVLRDFLGMSNSPVAVSVRPARGEPPEKKTRICRAILDAAAGESLVVRRENNACFGGSWHLGFRRIDDPKVLGMVKKFVVEGEKLFSSYGALENLIGQMGEAPDHARSAFLLSPLEKAEERPDLAVFVCDPEQACRLLTLLTFGDGKMPGIKIGGPTCRMALIYPLVSGEANVSFYDYTARKMCRVERDKLLVSLPIARLDGIVGAVVRCSAGTAPVEFPPEFRAFLQSRLTV